MDKTTRQIDGQTVSTGDQLTLLRLTGPGEQYKAVRSALCRATAVAMAQPPTYITNWPIEPTPSDPCWNHSIGGMWDTFMTKTETHGGLLIAYLLKGTNILAGYAHALILDDEQIERFALTHDALRIKAKAGDAALTYAGIHPELWGSRIDTERRLTIRERSGDPFPGYPNPPGMSIYETLFGSRIQHVQDLGGERRLFIRTRRDNPRVLSTSKRYQFEEIGAVEKNVGGVVHPLVILSRSAKL